MPLYQIKEYGKIVIGSDSNSSISSDGTLLLNTIDFDNVWNHILEIQTKNVLFEGAFKLSIKGTRRIIQAQNFVGLIETKNGISIEVLPKLYDGDGELSALNCKAIMLNMVASFLDFKFISEQNASRDVKKNFPIFEIFVNAYIQEVEVVLLKGLKKNYKMVEDNRRFLRGQLLFSKDIIHNQFDHSKFFTRANEYEIDTPQHRIIKSTLQKLLGVSKVEKNRSRLRYLLLAFVDLKSSFNFVADLDACDKSSRTFSEYKKLIDWSRIFLTNNSFSAFAGANDNKSLLFPMERLFESYIARLFKKFSLGYNVHTQHNFHHLVEEHNLKKKFRLKPDLYLTSLDNSHQIILDTKWKVLNENQPQKNYLISQSDMYQAYAYGKKYSNQDTVVQLNLIYPFSANFKKPLGDFIYEISDSKKLVLSVIPFDLKGNYAAQIQSILKPSD